MRWIEEPNKNFPKTPYHVLLVERDEPLGAAWIEYWKRILTDGYALPIPSRFSLAADIYARTFEKDGTGQSTAKFHNSLKRQADGIGTFHVRSDHFTLLQGKGEDDTAFARRQLVWLLESYKKLKAALQNAEVWPLYEKINNSHAMPVRLATLNGWFDLEPGKEGFGALPYEDQELLAGMGPTKADPMEELGRGVLTSPRTTAIDELAEALIQYTPPHFKNIHCTIREGVEEGQRALFYRIECPEFADEGTTVANDRMHRAATLLVQQIAPRQGTFPGVAIKLNMLPDGSWKRTVEMLSHQS